MKAIASNKNKLKAYHVNNDEQTSYWISSQKHSKSNAARNRIGISTLQTIQVNTNYFRARTSEKLTKPCTHENGTPTRVLKRQNINTSNHCILIIVYIVIESLYCFVIIEHFESLYSNHCIVLYCYH